ncbi:hypothetical protein NFI96_003283 [Prochilodus magdalenae]|nr:hypothetical protein NFI96_003283 [Prochilodus magdalenae]
MDVSQSSTEDPSISDSYYSYYSYNDSHLVQPVEEDMQQTAGLLTATFYSVIIFISLTGNSFLLWLLVKHKGFGSPANLLLLHLTISDLVFTVTLVPWAVYYVWGWLFGELTCRLFSGAIFLGFYSYMMFLTCMTLHRYIAVVHALRTAALDAHRGRFYTHLTCIVVWVVSAGCSLPEVFVSVTISTPDGVLCAATPREVKVELTVSYVQILVFFLLPFLVIVFCYVQILVTIQRCQMRNRERTVWLILCIVVGFFICWTPYNITIFLQSLQLLKVEAMSTYAWEKGLAYAYYITQIMAFSHCCLNPLIQIFGGVQFRSHLPWSSGFRRMSKRERSRTFSSQSAPYLSSVTGQASV